LSSFCSSLGSFGPAASFSNTVFVKILLECLGQLCPKVESLSLAGNDIVGLHCIRALHSALPALKNLDLSGNRISSLSDSLIAYKFQLSELVLTNNPVVNDALPALYHREVKSFFPALKMLDQKPMLSSVLNFTVFLFFA
jgi:Leucine-rich repeat (LRR) protein